MGGSTGQTAGVVVAAAARVRRRPRRGTTVVRLPLACRRVVEALDRPLPAAGEGRKEGRKSGEPDLSFSHAKGATVELEHAWQGTSFDDGS